jgi:hypothetical protein
MTLPPPNPSIFHITHVDNLPAILGAGGLLSDAVIIQQGGPAQTIGMSTIKQRRVQVLDVPCHPGTKVGDYVPFYFCPRSIMLYLIYMGNHPDLAYTGGQGPVVHLEADLQLVITWATAQSRRWAFSLSNAGSAYASFRNDVAHLNQIDWSAVAARDFRDAAVKESKQAEFLLHNSFPWHLIRRISVQSMAVYQRVLAALANTAHQPAIQIKPNWYY